MSPAPPLLKKRLTGQKRNPVPGHCAPATRPPSLMPALSRTERGLLDVRSWLAVQMFLFSAATPCGGIFTRVARSSIRLNGSGTLALEEGVDEVALCRGSFARWRRPGTREFKINSEVVN